MLVLPRDGHDLDTARQEMLQMIDDPITTVMVARGPESRAFAERADTIARLGRRVIHLEDPAVLMAEQEDSWFADQGGDPVVGAVLNDSSAACGHVLRKRQSRINIELAFLSCEKQKGDD